MILTTINSFLTTESLCIVCVAVTSTSNTPIADAKMGKPTSFPPLGGTLKTFVFSCIYVKLVKLVNYISLMMI